MVVLTVKKYGARSGASEVVMNKSTLSSWTLALFVICLLGGLAQVNSPQFAESVWTGFGTLAVAAVLGIVTRWLRASVKKEQAAAAEQRRQEQRRREEAARIAQEEREAKRKEERDRFRYETFPVAGVTFKNDDGSDRQKILREIALNNNGFAAVTFEENDDLGEDSGISVVTEFGCVGFIRRSDKAKVRKFFGRQTQSVYLSVELFESDDGEKIYRADVQITMKRGEPDQQWYFDDLPEQ